jgi:hypothetical protein
MEEGKLNKGNTINVCTVDYNYESSLIRIVDIK